MRRFRRTAFVAVLAGAAVACGLSVTGIGPERGDGGPSVETDGSPPRDQVVPDGQTACDAGGAFCDYCDPTLVLCVEFDGGFVDRSMYHRPVDIRGGTPAYLQENGLGAISLDGSVALAALGGELTPDASDNTIDMVVRARAVPADGGRFGLVDRNGAASIFLYPSALSCHGQELDGGKLPATFTHVTCVVSRATAYLYLDGQRVLRADAGPIVPIPTEPTMIGRDDDNGDLDSGKDFFQGDIASIRIYARATRTD